MGPDALRKLLEKCSKLGVSRLEYSKDGFVAEFYDKTAPKQVIQEAVIEAPKVSTPPLSLEQKRALDEIKKERQLEELMFNDPVAYEEYLLKEGENLTSVEDSINA